MPITKRKTCRALSLDAPFDSLTPATQIATRLLYARSEAARQLSISVRSLDYLIAANSLRVRRKGGRVLIPHAELLRFAAFDSDLPLVTETMAA